MQQQEWNTTKVLLPNKYVATLNNNRHLPGTTIVPLGKIQYHRLHRGVKLSARILEVQVEMEVVVVVVDGVAAAVVVADQVVAGENNMYQNTKTKLITIVILFITLLHYFIISMVLWSIFVLENCFFKNFTSFFFTYDRIYFLNIFVFF